MKLRSVKQIISLEVARDFNFFMAVAKVSRSCESGHKDGKTTTPLLILFLTTQGFGADGGNLTTTIQVIVDIQESTCCHIVPQ